LLGPDGARAHEEAITRVLESASHLGEPWVAYASLRFNGYSDASGAVRALKRAVAVAPSLADAHDLLGRLLVEIGEVEDGLVRLQHALWLDATNVFTPYDLMRVAAYRGDWDRVVELSKITVRSAARIQITRVALWLERSADDIEHVCAAHPMLIDGGAKGLYEMMVRAARERQISETDRAQLNEMTTLPMPRARRLFAQNAAEVHGFCRNDDEAMRFVQIAVDAGLIDLYWMKHNPTLSRIRDREAFVRGIEVVSERVRPILEAWREPTGA
jgi:serine/threonine-protein kinase